MRALLLCCTVTGLLLGVPKKVWLQAPPSPVLSLDDAVALAMKGNRQVQSAELDVARAHETQSVVKTQNFPQLSLYFLGGESLRSIDFTIPQGIFGTYPGTGPIPRQTSKISTPPSFNEFIVGQAAQPISQLWKIHLASLDSRITADLAREALWQQRQDTAYPVRDLYHQIAQTQTQVESAEANLKYLLDLQQETDRNLAEQTALKSDSLVVKAKVSQQRLMLLTLHDTLASQKEAMNRNLGRDLSTEFSVEAEPALTDTEIDLQAARQEALKQRPEIRQARLQTKKATVQVRRQRAEYLPDFSANFTYFSVPNVSFLPQNVMSAGFLLQWQPLDWGQKYHKIEALKDSVKQASLTEADAEQRVVLDVNTKFRKLAEARASLDTSAVAQEAEREKLRVVTNRYSQKAALLSEVLQEDAAVAQVEADFQKALADFWSAKASFEHALGRD